MDDLIRTPETELLGIALTDARALDEVDDLVADDFEDERLGEMWAVVQRLAQAGKPHTEASVSAVGAIDKHLVSELAIMAPVGAAAPYFADLIQKQATRRRLIQAGTRMVQLAEESELDGIPDAVEIARGEVDAAGRVGSQLEGVMAGSYFDHHLALMRQPTRLSPTPWDDLNHLIGGWRPGALYVIAARPSVGKSVLGLQAALGLQREGTVLFSTLEMTRAEVENRIIAQVASVPLRELISGEEMEQRHWARIEQHAGILRGHRIHIDDRAGVTPTDIRSAARTIARRGKLAAVVVDYLQLMSAPKGDRRQRHEVVADYSRSLKLLAKELQVPVLAMAQVNRASTQGEERPPKISELRESGAVEQDADVIMLLHQPEDPTDRLMVRVGKNRHGAKGNFELLFEGTYVRAVDQGWTPPGFSS